ncbi:MAG: MFS transporter [bacterium]|nr:MAG: MFS transporter [bacterium]
MMIELINGKWQRINDKFNYYDKRVWLLLSIRVINALGFSIVLPFISIYLFSEKNVAMTLIGSIFLSVAVIRALMQILGGSFADRYSRQQIMLIAGIGRTVAFILLAMAIMADLPLYVIGITILLAYGFGSMFMPAADAMISDVVSAKDRIEAYGFQRMGFNFGWAIGPAIGGYLASVSYHLIFLIAAFFFTIAVIVIYRFIPDSHTHDVRSQFRFKDLNKLINNYSFIFYGILVMLVFSTITQIVTTLSVFSIEVVKISKIQLGYLYTVNGAVIILFQIQGIRWIKRIPLTRALALGASLAAVSYLVVAISTNFLMLAAAIVILTFGEIFFIPAGTTLASNWAPEFQKGSYLGLYGVFQGLGRSIGPFYGGILVDHFLNRPFILWGTLTGIGLLAAVGLSQVKRFISAKVNKE